MTDKIIIVGGGPVGAVLALSLQQSGIACTVLEACAKGASHGDKRALALSQGSRLILEKLGVWNAVSVSATAINSIHISQRGGFGRTKLNASEHGLPALGYVLPYGELTKALDAKLEQAAQLENTDVLYEAIALEVMPDIACGQVTFTQSGKNKTLSSPLVVVADGGNNLQIIGVKRETKEYGHNALVSKVRAELPHHNVAYERFTLQGPMALLPNGECDFSLVWTGEKTAIEALLSLNDATFLAQLHTAFGDRVGQFLSVEKRLSFPLKLSTLKPSNAPHVVIIGNAAQTMHPVAGQGFNVGLRDAANLAQVIVNASPADWGSATMLETYSASRNRDTKGGILFTDFLVNIFSNDLIGVSTMRGAGLGLLDILKPAKSFLVGKMSYGK